MIQTDSWCVSTGRRTIEVLKLSSKTTQPQAPWSEGDLGNES
ncbi:hypothetical protein SynA1825c_01396 [Synechococcus sp. A18-25c]|nr:hypothetical protein SynA1560_01413 [Synechococcus sp. A15-60]QNJ19702.1 hypothetical protein SynA1825c_01396 [Synechococcus sp. A18-25c]